MGIGLALGGGGARGMAHLGVLKVLEDNNIKIDALAGTSIGGLVGAVYLSGYSARDMLDRFSKIEQTKLYGQLKSQEPSLIGLAGATKVLSEMLEDRTFDDLKIPFAVTSVDINRGELVVINKGKLFDAVLSTIAVPGVLPARRQGDSLLVDGGVYDPVPVDVVRDLKPNIPVVAVVLSQNNSANLSLPVLEIPGAAPVFDYISKLRISQALNVFIRSIDVASKMFAEYRLEVEKPEVIIRPDLGNIGILDQVDVDEMAAKGEEAALAAIPKISHYTSLQYRLRNWLGFQSK